MMSLECGGCGRPITEAEATRLVPPPALVAKGSDPMALCPACARDMIMAFASQPPSGAAAKAVPGDRYEIKA